MNPRSGQPLYDDPELVPNPDQSVEQEFWRIARHAYEHHGLGYRASADVGAAAGVTRSPNTVGKRARKEGWTQDPETNKRHTAAVEVAALVAKHNVAEHVFARRSHYLEVADKLLARQAGVVGRMYDALETIASTDNRVFVEITDALGTRMVPVDGASFLLQGDAMLALSRAATTFGIFFDKLDKAAAALTAATANTDDEAPLSMEERAVRMDELAAKLAPHLPAIAEAHKTFTEDAPVHLLHPKAL